MRDENESQVPIHTVEALDRYWTYGYGPGSFLTSLLCGNIYGSVVRADRWNKEALGHIVEYILRNAPPGSYGREDLVQDWINQGEMFQRYQKTRVMEYLSQ